MWVQIFVSGFLLDPGCDVTADFLIIIAFVDWAITNKLLVYVFILFGGASHVGKEYFVRLVIAALLSICFGSLYTYFIADESLTFDQKEKSKLLRLITTKPAS